MARASLNAQFILTRTRLNKEIIELSETVLQVPHSPVAPPTGHRRSGRTSSLHRAQYCVDPISNVLISGVFGAILRDLKCPDQSLDGQGIRNAQFILTRTHLLLRTSFQAIWVAKPAISSFLPQTCHFCAGPVASLSGWTTSPSDWPSPSLSQPHW